MYDYHYLQEIYDTFMQVAYVVLLGAGAMWVVVVGSR